MRRRKDGRICVWSEAIGGGNLRGDDAVVSYADRGAVFHVDRGWYEYHRRERTSNPINWRGWNRGSRFILPLRAPIYCAIKEGKWLEAPLRIVMRAILDAIPADSFTALELVDTYGAHRCGARRYEGVVQLTRRCGFDGSMRAVELVEAEYPKFPRTFYADPFIPDRADPMRVPSSTAYHIVSASALEAKWEEMRRAFERD